MLLRCKCPGCGDLKEYVAEQVGTTADCFRCGHRFTLLSNPGRVTWHIIAATLAVLLMIVGFSARMYLRSQRWQARHHAANVAHDRQVHDGDDKDDDRDD